jgi:dimethylhistidine N-methyltransferase
VLDGLAQPQKQIHPKYFYDAIGCKLFESICGLPEYYPTRTELAIMRSDAGEMAHTLGAGCAVIEIGCGNSEKTRLLLKALRPVEFVPIDIAREQLEISCNMLAQSFPGMSIVAVRADFARPVDLPLANLRRGCRRILYFPGSTIGNFKPDEAHQFLRRWAPMLRPGGGALIGVDLEKDPALLNAAYNDTQGVTAAFNLNVLSRLNRELGANFDVHAFHHRALHCVDPGRVEMHLVSKHNQEVSINGRTFTFRADETIHTESSYKYSLSEFQDLGRGAGFEPVQYWTDADNLFSVHYFKLPD